MWQLVSRPMCLTCRMAARGMAPARGLWSQRAKEGGVTHQVLRAVQLVSGGGAARDERLEHAAHHHRLHVLGHRLVVACGEVVAEARLVWAERLGGAKRGGWGENA